MKIYNEIISRFNEQTGLWETISEDSFEHTGHVALAQGASLPNSTAIIDEDKITDTVKTTTGYFTNGDGTLEGNVIHTGSLADANEKYYFNVIQTHPASSSAETQFSVAYADARGSGSDALGDTSDPSNLKAPTEAIYKQFASILLPEGEASGGFKISQQGDWVGSLATGVRDDYLYILVAKRAKMKDRLNKKSWTLTLSGSSTNGTTTGTGGHNILKLTDDSNNVGAVATPAGPRHNIVEGELGSPTNAYTSRSLGWIYPDQGIMIFSGAELSASIPGQTGIDSVTRVFKEQSSNSQISVLTISQSGFAPNLANGSNAGNALSLVQCMQNMGSSVSLRIRGEEDLTQENYFCRIKAGQYNFSNNPTFTSGSGDVNKLRHSTMRGNPTTFITGIGLYNASGMLLATAKLSSPLKKNFVSEATVKVKLTY